MIYYLVIPLNDFSVLVEVIFSLKCWSTSSAFCLFTSIWWLFNLRLNWVSHLSMYWICAFIWYITSLLLQPMFYKILLEVLLVKLLEYTIHLQHRLLDFEKDLVKWPIFFFEFFYSVLYTIPLHHSELNSSRTLFCLKCVFFEYLHLSPALYTPIHNSLMEILYQLYIYIAGVMFPQMVCCVLRNQDVLICCVNKPVSIYPLYIT